MTVERYTKFGRVVRLEQDFRRTAIITVDESGQSVLDGDRFEARPIDERVELPPLHPEVVEAVAARIAALLEPPLVIERLLITQGVARHRFECGDERNEWQDEAARIHLAIAQPHRRLRCLIDLGGTSFDELDLQEVRDSVAALLLPQTLASTTGNGSLLLAPNVAAALWSAMATFAPLETVGPLSLHQTAGGVDGRGRPIADLTLIGRGASVLANTFRPSYRTRPVAAAFRVRAIVADRLGGEAFAEAVTLLGPIAIRDDSIEMSVLAKCGEHAQPIQLRGSLDRWVQGVEAVDVSERAYPLAAGASGSRSRIASGMLVG